MSNEHGGLTPWLTKVGVDQHRAELVAEEISLQCSHHESIQYRLRGKGQLVHEHEGETERIEPENGETLFALITDKQLLFGYHSPTETTIEPVSHANITAVDIAGRLLKKLLVVEVWEGGTYKFRPASKDQLSEISAYLESVSDCWQIVESLFEDLSKTRATLTTQIESGDVKEAQETVEAAEKTLERIRSQMVAGDLKSVIGPRLADAERTLHQRRMNAHLTRAETLVSDAKQLTADRAYTGAYNKYDRARKHLDIALSLADSRGFDHPPAITELRDTIENRIANLQVLPKALGEQATERAKGTDHPDVAAEAWQEAFDHFRDALTAGWGTDFSFSGDREDLQFTVEVTVANLISARREYATECIQKAENARKNENEMEALRCYREAQRQLEQAKQLAKEFRSGDPQAIESQIETVSVERDQIQAANSAEAV